MGPSYGQPTTVETYPRTFTLANFAASRTTRKRSMLSAVEQFTFFLENVSEAAPNTATSVAPAASYRKINKINNYFILKLLTYSTLKAFYVWR